MKILLLGHGKANDGAKRLLERELVDYDYLDIDSKIEEEYDLIVKSPGIPLSSPFFAKHKGKIISDIELGYLFVKPFIIGVTGSNGKTTVVKMLEHVLKDKFSVVVCGNIGYSFCDALVDHYDAQIFIVEMSSFQLEAIDYLDCDISVITNITPAHLDHHGTFEKYVSAKLNICFRQSINHHCVYNYDNIAFKAIERRTYANRVPYSINSSTSKIYVLNKAIWCEDKKIIDLSNEEIKKEALLANYLAVLSVCLIMNLNLKNSAKKLKSFEPVRYRLTKLDDFFYNDAKSTNTFATMYALYYLDKVILICGGYDRNIPLYLDKRALNSLVSVYSYGQMREKLATYFTSNGIKSVQSETLSEAFVKAVRDKKNDEIILFSPMCASFDQYQSFEKRGEEFDDLYEEYKKTRV